MVLREYAPGPGARGTIRVYRIVHFETADSCQPAVKVYPPTPEQSVQLFLRDRELVVYPGGRRAQWNCALVGAHDVTVQRIVPPRFLMVQAVFEPGALYRLVGVAGDELRNLYLDAEGVLGSAVRRLRDAMGDAKSYAGMISRVDEFFRDLETARPAVHSIEARLRWLRDDPAASIDHAASQCSLSLRQFERACRQHTGLGPKELASLARFDRAFHAKLQRPGLDWLSIAIACGYYDYQHMARDFRSFTGQTPPRLLDTQRTSPEQQLGVRQEFDLSYGDLLPALAGRLRRQTSSRSL
jgi:AraC-like DNA-binding protein